MPLVLAFAGIVGGFLLLTHSLTEKGTSYGSILRGDTTLATGPTTSDGSGGESAAAVGGSSTNLGASEDNRVASADAAAGNGRLPAKVDAMLTTATTLVGAPYTWGGGHGSSFQPLAVLKRAGVDCSGFVSRVLGSAGILSAPQTTQTLPSANGIAAGPGQYVTIYDRTDGQDGGDHVIIDIAGHWFESGGDAIYNGGGGVGAIAKPPTSYLSSFNLLLHPVGL